MANRQLTANGTCIVAQCPKGCQACGVNGECWPCGRVFRPTAAHTLASVSFRCNLTPDAIVNANPELKDQLQNLAPEASLAGVNKLKMPPAVCT